MKGENMNQIIKSSIFLLWSFLFMNTSVSARIGIMGALNEEIKMLKDEMKLTKEIKIAGRVFYLGKLEGKEIVLVEAGMGKVNAAITSQLLITQFKVEKIIFTGIAGGVSPDLGIGDLVIATKVAQHDYGSIGSQGFFPFRPGTLPVGEVNIESVYFKTDEKLLNIAMSASDGITLNKLPEGTILSNEGRIPKIVSGIIVTGDQFVVSKIKRKWLFETFNALATEMEGGAVAQVCEINNIPFLLIRSISDLANEDAEVNFNKFVDYAAKNSVLLVKKILSKI
jgi:adenosylhomocysteine nucleosidase